MNNSIEKLNIIKQCFIDNQFNLKLDKDFSEYQTLFDDVENEIWRLLDEQYDLNEEIKELKEENDNWHRTERIRNENEMRRWGID